MGYKTRCLIIVLLITLIITILSLVFLLNLHKDSFFYCYIFDTKKFYKSFTINKLKYLYPKINVNYEDKLVFDYIIIGAGTAGSVIANRLSEKTTYSVLVIEAGKNMNGNLLKEIPGLAPLTWSNTYGDFTWNFTSIPQKGMLNRQFKWPAGKMIGGSSSNNFMIFSQIFAKNYNDWDKITGCNNWNWDNVNDYFFQIEENSVKPVKSTKLGKLWNELWQNESNIVQEDKMMFFIKNGIRWDTSKQHLYSASKRPNVYILSETYVKKILFHLKNDGKNDVQTAFGIEIKNKNEVRNIYVNKDIILSAGTLENVKILKQSLSEINKDKHNKNWNSIGKKFKDHLFVPLFFEIMSPQVYGYSNSILSIIKSFWNYLFFSNSFLAQTMIDGGHIYLDTKLNDSNWTLINFSPNIQVALISSLIDETSLDKIFSKYLDSVGINIYKKMINKAKSTNGFAIFVILVNPKSSGTIDYTTTFEIDPQYLTKNEDTIALLTAIERVLNLVTSSDILKDLKIKILKPDDDENEFIKDCYLGSEVDEIEQSTKCLNSTDFNKKYWICYIKRVAYSIFHYHGTVKFGNNEKSEYPLDCDLKLRNTTNVHVVDASVIPHPVSGGLQSVVMMIAEKFVKEFNFKSIEPDY